MTLQCVTSDQQRYIWVYEIASSMKINFFFRLDGFHQMMSFLVSIGSLMEGSGLTSALETVYTPVTVGHMFSGKACSPAFHGHFQSTSALPSIMPEEFLNELRILILIRKII